MVDSHNPVVSLPAPLLLAKLSHTLSGLYTWEYFTSLEYEWSVIRGHRPYRWTIWIYSLARLSALMTVFSYVFIGDNTGRINCQVFNSFQILFVFVTMSASSLLIVLRVVAIWNGNKVAMAIAISMWGVNAVFFLQLVARIRSVSAPAKLELTCITLNVKSSAPNLISMLITDVVLLLMMLVGLFRLRRHGYGRLAQVLWKQGVIWLFLCIMAEAPPTVFMNLDSNGLLEFAQVFMLLTWITMVISATRMHRSLTDFVCSSADVAQGELVQNSSPPVQRTQRVNAGSTPVN